MTNKVVIVIVEGESDKSLISDRLEEYFDDYDINFAIIGTDVFTRTDIEKIRAHINEQIDNQKSVRKFHTDDILCVIHVTDTDGCFIDPSRVCVDNAQEKATIYSEDFIHVKLDEQKKYMEAKNSNKASMTNDMAFESNILYDGTAIKYQLYYFSRHIEHVLFDNINPAKKLKVSKVNRFLRDLETDLEVWLDAYSPSYKNHQYKDKYIESWNHVKTDQNSLKRSTNFTLAFEYIDSHTTK